MVVVCAICRYIKTVLKVYKDKVDKNNFEVAMYKFEKF